MPEPTEDMRELLRAIQTEIGAGKGFGSDPLTEVHNAACDRAIAIVRSYRDGVGLFQLTGKAMKAPRCKRAEVPCRGQDLPNATPTTLESE